MTVRALTDLGWHVVRVSEALDERAPDSDILEYAGRHGQVIITQDLDFSALLAVGGHARPSVISLRLQNPRPDLVTRRVIEVVSEMGDELAQGAVVSVDESAARYRTLPISAEIG